MRTQADNDAEDELIEMQLAKDEKEEEEKGQSDGKGSTANTI